MPHVTSIGLDVHARSIKGCAFNPFTGEISRKSFPYDPASVADWILSFESPRAVYESGVTGFHLCRELRRLGVDCVIGAVSKMRKPAADKRRKTDKRDAEFLAKQLALHEIVEVHVPDCECEGARDLSRALADAREDVAAAKQRLSKHLLRNGRCYPSRDDQGRRLGTWTRAHWAWIEAVEMADPAAQQTLDCCKERVKRAVDEKKDLESKVRSQSEQPRWKPTVDALRCMKGVDVAAAFALACEVDGFSRFRNASAFSSWLGIVPSESSSADKQRRGGITKSGNKHLRKMLVESARRCCRLAGHGGKALCKGQVVSAPVKRHADKGCRRLKERFDDLVDSGKRPVVANCAIARELACWCWALGKMAESAQPQRAGISARSRDRQKRGPAAQCAAA